MLFLTPRSVKHGRQFIKDARKLIAYKRDLASEETISDVEREITHLEHAVASRDASKIEPQMERLNAACGRLTKAAPDAYMRENVEVFLVAIVVALAVRTYFLQPFTIPTGSMQPTLNGIRGYTAEETTPNLLTQAVSYAAFGRTYVDVVAEADEELEPVHEATRSGWRHFFTYTAIETSAGNTYYVNAGADTVVKMLNPDKRAYKKGEVILRGYVETGDHVFVDKVTYNFRRPERSDVFVFSTHGIPLLNPPDRPSQFYIKRLAGLPNDELRIEPPKLFVNGREGTEPGLQRVMSGTVQSPLNTYRGYSNGYETRWGSHINPMNFLTNPQESFQVPPHNYFALGDNTYYSSDSRQWSTVPEKNVMGRAVFVYWPFTKHWSFIH